MIIRQNEQVTRSRVKSNYHGWRAITSFKLTREIPKHLFISLQSDCLKPVVHLLILWNFSTSDHGITNKPNGEREFSTWTLSLILRAVWRSTKATYFHFGQTTLSITDSGFPLISSVPQKMSGHWNGQHMRTTWPSTTLLTTHHYFFSTTTTMVWRHNFRP